MHRIYFAKIESVKKMFFFKTKIKSCRSFNTDSFIDKRGADSFSRSYATAVIQVTI